jgi:protein-disulfide isomerase-like protein with CxxC motif
MHPMCGWVFGIQEPLHHRLAIQTAVPLLDMRGISAARALLRVRLPGYAHDPCASGMRTRHAHE